MNRKCLVCGRDSAFDALLCQHCGAPMSDEAPIVTTPEGPTRSRARTRKNIAILAVAGLVLAGAAVGAYVMFTGPKTDAMEASRALPKGLTFVGGFDIYAFVRSDWIKNVLDTAEAEKALRMLRQRSGIDVKKLDAAYGGSQLIDGEVHLLVLMSGEFDTKKVEDLFSFIASNEVEVGGHVLRELSMPGLLFPGLKTPETEFQFQLGEEQDAEDEDEPLAGKAEIVDEEPAPPPPPALKPAQVVLGVINDHFLMGSPTLIERWLKQDGDTVDDDAVMKGLLDRIDKNAIAWGVGSIGEDDLSMFNFYTQLQLEDALVDDVANSSVIMQLKLSDRLELKVEVDVATTEAAERLKDNLGLAQTVVAAMATLQGMPEPTINVKGKTIEATFSMKLPELPPL